MKEGVGQTSYYEWGKNKYYINSKISADEKKPQMKYAEFKALLNSITFYSLIWTKTPLRMNVLILNNTMYLKST